MTEPTSIPCVADKDAATWSYVFPTAYDNELDKISYIFESTISDLVTFHESNFTLTLNLNTSNPDYGSYTSTITLKD